MKRSVIVCVFQTKAPRHWDLIDVPAVSIDFTQSCLHRFLLHDFAFRALEGTKESYHKKSLITVKRPAESANCTLLLCLSLKLLNQTLLFVLPLSAAIICPLLQRLSSHFQSQLDNCASTKTHSIVWSCHRANIKMSESLSRDECRPLRQLGLLTLRQAALKLPKCGEKRRRRKRETRLAF